MPLSHLTDQRVFADWDDLRGVADPDFLALGLGATNMMSMLWTVAMGGRAVGVERRGDPPPGESWNIAADTFHQLGLIDSLMLRTYGEEGLPRFRDGRVFRLASCFYDPEAEAKSVFADEIVSGFESSGCLAGRLEHVEHIDDRWVAGRPQRVVTVQPPAEVPVTPDPSAIRSDVAKILCGEFPFQLPATELLILLRRYLETIEEMDLAKDSGTPRVRLFTHHQVVPDGGFVEEPDGRRRVIIEAVQELDYKQKFIYRRQPGTEPIDLGVPELFSVAQGVDSDDAAKLGFRSNPVGIDYGDGRGPVPAQSDYVACLLNTFVEGRSRRRITTVFDEDGDEYWVRQMAIGQEDDPEVGWIMLQVPAFKSFDPVEEGVLPEGTDRESPDYFAAYQQLLYDFFFDHAEELLEMPREKLTGINTFYGPKLVTVAARIGVDAQIAVNGIVASNTFGTGHFLNNGVSVTGMICHSARVLRYWIDRRHGVVPGRAIRRLAEGIRLDTEEWIRVSAVEFSMANPRGFEPECFELMEAAREHRDFLVSLDLADWNRLIVHIGRLGTQPLRPPHPLHPEQRRKQRNGRAPVPAKADAADQPAPAKREADAMLVES
ncbi:hypothetical protein SAMN02982929_05531 [Saccharopolyspora kobensis]|uniref:Uncharacterized protein n=1 Tax=Saccharopolyspora kobensis TaxID=146035 RepID=A0A1H6E3Q7_9PSEU|nr:hypothetical protein SAMN02982929_05531 [Saccharopolyspora kobensis]SFD36775.1 hypothetical protein SAMN05216506_10460 [Saccharopolyspora kobensis]